MNKIKVYHFHNGSGGGVLSVIKNMLKYSQNHAIENHVIYTINIEEKAVYPVNNFEGAFSEQVFYYSPKWNFYYTCRQLAKMLPDDKSLVIAHDWLELGMMSNLGLQNPIVYFLHGDYDYYYQLAQKHESAIDQFICVAKSIETKLLTLLPARKENIAYLRFPVPEVSTKQIASNEFPIVFIGRLNEGKGYPLLPVIAEELRKKNFDIFWHILGTADMETDEILWDENIQVHFYNNISNEEVLALLAKMKIIILPSLAEGMPVALIEAMKAGVIPLVNNIDGGIQELVVDEQTGYKINGNEIADYVKKIILLIGNKSLAEKIKINCIKKANELFNPINNTKRIELVFESVVLSTREIKYAKKIYGSRLDQNWLPNIFTRLIRGIKCE
jgi:glycosyltransferase involved in cell wall biosynthesis